MMNIYSDYTVKARAYPLSDAQQRPRLIPATSGPRLPRYGRTGLKKIVFRLGTLNVGSMTGRGRELANLMEKRKIRALCVQETRWRGDKAKELGDGYKLFYSGANRDGRNGVGIILDRYLKEQLVRVNRRNDRIMSVGIECGVTTLNIVCAYAPQPGCEESEKVDFWRELDEELAEIPKEEGCFIGGDLNGHVGGNRMGFERVHGGWGLGMINAEGKEVLDFAAAADMAVINTFFKKTEHQYVTYKSGRAESQIDYVLCRRTQLGEVNNCKVIKGECVTSQHRPVIVDCAIRPKRKGKQKREQKIKWWKLKDLDLAKAFKKQALEKIGLYECVNEWWEENSKVLIKAGEEILGKTTGKGPPQDKETWWWNEEVQEKIRFKKMAKKRYDLSQKDEDRADYKQANREAKRAVAIAKAKASERLYEELETTEGQNRLYSIARARDKASKDFTHIRQIKDIEGRVLRKEEEIKNRWQEYFKVLLNEEHPRKGNEGEISNDVETVGIEREEISEALGRMKRGKAVGPDNLPVEAWKALGKEGVDILWDLLCKVHDEERIPEAWRESVVVPIYKGKGDIQECRNYRGIKLVSHTMKIWERIIDSRIRKGTIISDKQFGFMPGRGTMDPLFALRQLLERYGEKKKDLHLIFIDLEKAYDTIPREELWRCMAARGVPEKYVRVVKDMYHGAHTRVRSSVGVSDSFPVTVGLHQGSALSPYLFNIVLDVLTERMNGVGFWSGMFADDIVIVEESREGVERALECWRQAIEDGGLRISRKKTEYLWFGGESKDGEVYLQGEKLQRVRDFKYLGSFVSSEGGLDKELDHRIQVGWMNWRRVSGVLCDRKVNAKAKGKIFKTVVRPAMIYGSETWPIKKAQERKLDVAEMRMVRWALGKTRRDRVRNVKIRGMAGVVEVSKKIQESRLRWFGHVMRREEEYVGKRMLNLNVEGKRPRGRPKRRWMDCVTEDCRQKGLEFEDAQDRTLWRGKIKMSDP